MCRYHPFLFIAHFYLGQASILSVHVDAFLQTLGHSLGLYKANKV